MIVLPQTMLDVNKSLRTVVVNRVLGCLGEEMLAVLKYHLQRHYAIDLDAGQHSFSVDELQYALSELLGENIAELLITEIREEIAHLSQERSD